VAAGRLANQSDPPWIDVVLGCIHLNETDCRLDVVGIRRKFVLRRESIVDAEPREPCVGQGLEDIRDVLLLIACYPASAVHEHGRRKGTGSLWNMRVQR